MMQDNDIEKQTGKRLTLQQQSFFKSDAALNARSELTLMMGDVRYNTRATYRSGNEAGLSFVDQHLLYLSLHPNVSTQHYLSNLRLKSKIRI